MPLSESKKLTDFLSQHFKKIDESGAVALKAVGLVEDHFEKAIKSLDERTQKMIEDLGKSSGNHKAKVEDIYKAIENSLESNVTSQYVNDFKEAYLDAIPKFNQLDNLKLMEEINGSLNNMKQSKALMNKLDSIEESLRTRSSRNNGKGTTPPKKSEGSNSKKTITPLKIVKSVLKR